eukprot:CAMPEP_0118949866 /NCGR_PEP_ID=MMETSP1169-20130426/50374_1 /TAXON_ID=36882 /ORGANISM="Pyramimonas obovata, Strain CCMP722" /LENGTH=850 /DNA_ID=CAMNT_0006896579 /DNA_START=76 /DNA_END=2624 /DNA_ORIENTATION=+
MASSMCVGSVRATSNIHSSSSSSNRLSHSRAVPLTTHRVHRRHAQSDRRHAVTVTARAGGGGPGMAGAAQVATVAALEVSKAVRNKGVEAPDADQSFVALDEERRGQVDAEGLPVVYDKDLIQKYWQTQGNALQQRWTEFVGYSVPYLTRVVGMLITGGTEELQKNGATLAKDARVIFEKLGPTYIKMGQMMSVRPDVLPPDALKELAILQDSVKPFPTEIALRTIEEELGRPIDEVFSELSEEPIAAASLAQVYRGKLVEDGRWVAVKVQRPEVLSTVSKDLYVLRRAAEVYQGLVERFAPQQRTNYVALLNEWAVGFYTELDFMNEGRNQQKIKDLLIREKVEGVYVPEVMHHLCTRRLLVTEWIDGVKLSECGEDEIGELTALGQECFLVQLLQVGFFHSDPHPGNLMRMDDQSKGRLALLDFGLVATVKQEDQDTIVSSIVHLANKDYASLVDDFIKLKILPEDCDRSKVEPLMDKALSPYVKGGGAKKYEEELKKMYGFEDGNAVGGFQAMTQDMLTVMNDIPFSIPPYFALLARAVVTLEGIALGADPDYRMVMEAYPFVARKLLSDDRPEIQKALQEVLYKGGGEGQLTPERLAVLLNSAMGIVSRSSESVFVDFDSVPEDGISVKEAVRYLLSPQAASLRDLLEGEAITAADILLRQATRKLYSRYTASLPTNPFASFLPLPALNEIPGPVLLPTGDPTKGGSLVPVIASPEQLVEAAAPKLTRDEELYALSLKDLAKATAGEDVASVVSGDVVAEPQAVARLALAALASGSAPGLDNAALKGLASQLREQLLPADAEERADAEASLQELVTFLTQDLSAEETATLNEFADRIVAHSWFKVA